MRVDGTTTPMDVPDIRLHLLDQWAPGRVFDTLYRNDTRNRPSPHSQASALRGALYWVSTDLFRVIAVMASQIPPETRLDDLHIPEVNGLVVYENPGQLLRDDGVGMSLAAMTFTRTLLAECRQDEHHQHDVSCTAEAVPGMYFGFYCRYRLSDGRTGWWPMCYETWDFGESVPGKTVATALAARRELPADQPSAGSLQLFAAFVMLINQEIRVADHVDQEMPRPVARRSQRQNLPSKVRVVRLRKLTRRETGGTGERSVEWTHRWWVKGHPRLQWVGPGRSQRRLVYVHPYIKGPDDKPLVLKDTVGALVR